MRVSWGREFFPPNSFPIIPHGTRHQALQLGKRASELLQAERQKTAASERRIEALAMKQVPTLIVVRVGH